MYVYMYIKANVLYVCMSGMYTHWFASNSIYACSSSFFFSSISTFTLLNPLHLQSTIHAYPGYCAPQRRLFTLHTQIMLKQSIVLYCCNMPLKRCNNHALFQLFYTSNIYTYICMCVCCCVFAWQILIVFQHSRSFDLQPIDSWE